ncbi:MAG: hypothetical protein GY795_48295 [Desulfobacterales bacterium]|nr:hypothetical protein [Desulfobacterales bacterium]
MKFWQYIRQTLPKFHFGTPFESVRCFWDKMKDARNNISNSCFIQFIA